MKRSRSATPDPVSAARKRAKGLIDRCNDISKYVRKNTEQIQALEADSRSALDSCKPIMKDLDKAIESYSQALCLEQCNAIRATFPREIRDMIWTELCTYRFTLATTEECDEHCKHAVEPHKTTFKNMHWLYPEFVGEETAAEIVEVFYKSNSFKVKTCTDLQKFLTDKSLGGGIVPADCVKSLNLGIYDSDFSDCDQPDWVPMSRETDEQYILKDLQHILQSLHSVRYAEGFKLTIVLYASIHAAKTAKMIGAMHPILEELCEKGFKLKVQMVRLRGYPAHSLDVTYIFKQKNWEEALKRYSSAQLKKEQDDEDDDDFDDYDDYDDYGGYYDEDFYGYDEIDAYTAMELIQATHAGNYPGFWDLLSDSESDLESDEEDEDEEDDEDDDDSDDSDSDSDSDEDSSDMEDSDGGLPDLEDGGNQGLGNAAFTFGVPAAVPNPSVAAPEQVK